MRVGVCLRACMRACARARVCVCVGVRVGGVGGAPVRACVSACLSVYTHAECVRGNYPGFLLGRWSATAGASGRLSPSSRRPSIA